MGIDKHVEKVLTVLFVFGTFTEAALKDPAWKHCMNNVHAFPGKWGSIKSPGFPNGINTQIQCSWVIQSNPGYKVKLAFHTLNMTGSRGSCFTQFAEILDYKVGHSMGKFCGASRPGDYVSYGYKVRFDLQGDTSGAKTKGFDLRYKAVKEVGGFKTSWAFNTKRTAKNRRRSSSKTKSGNSKPKKAIGPAKVSGRNPRKGPNSADPSSQSETAATSRSQGKPSRPPPPNRVEFRSPPSRRTMGPVIYGANSNARAVDHGRSSVITVEPDTSETTLDYAIIAGIAAGGAVLLVIIIVVLKLCVCDRAKRKKSNDANMKTSRIHDGQPRFPMVPIPGIVPEQHADEEIVQRHPSFNRLPSWSGMQPTMPYLQYPVTVDQTARRAVSTMPHSGVRSSRSRTADSRKSNAVSSKSYTSQRSESRTRRSSSRPRSEMIKGGHSRSRSLTYLPSQMDGWVRVEDLPVSRMKRPSHSDFESSDVSDSSSSYTESDSSDDYRRRKARSRRKHRGSLKRNKYRLSRSGDDRPPPYYVIEKTRDFDEGYDTGRKATNAYNVKSRKSQPSNRRKRKGKRSRKYSY